MSECQYYEFQAIDRPLGTAEQAALRAISSRARITSTSFTNTYEWGDLKADPIALLGRYFDVFIYLANWRSRRFAMRLPRRLVDIDQLRRFGISDDVVRIDLKGEHALIDIFVDEVETEDWEDGSGRLGGLAPLRAALIDGDYSLFLLLWLVEVEHGGPADDAEAPVAGPGRLLASIAAVGDFLGVNPDLITAAFGALEATMPDDATVSGSHDVEAADRTLSEEERMAFLVRLHTGNDPYLSAELRRRCGAGPSRHRKRGCSDKRLTAGELRRTAAAIAARRAHEAAAKAALEKRRREEAEAAERRRRLDALAKHGEAAWKEVEDQIELRNAGGYDRATALLVDLAALADIAGHRTDFERRTSQLAQRHERKGQFVRRLVAASLVTQQ